MCCVFQFGVTSLKQTGFIPSFINLAVDQRYSGPFQIFKIVTQPEGSLGKIKHHFFLFCPQVWLHFDWPKRVLLIERESGENISCPFERKNSLRVSSWSLRPCLYDLNMTLHSVQPSIFYPVTHLDRYSCVYISAYYIHKPRADPV